MDTILTLISIVATIVSIVVGILLWRKSELLDEQSRTILSLRREANNSKEHISTLEKFCATVSTVEEKRYHVILIGPRNSGKSSITSLWCKVDKLITTISPTPTFDTYDYDGLNSKKEDFFDTEIKVKRIKKVQKIIRFFDYAGEDEQIPNAIERIASSPDCTIIMVFNSDPGYENDNRRYFSRSLVEKINSKFNESGFKASNVKVVYVVFNKIDLFAKSGSTYNDNLEKIKQKFIDNISNIETIFGVDVRYIVTSASTNHNIINLLQNVVRAYVK